MLTHFYRLKSVSEDGVAVLESDPHLNGESGPREIIVRDVMFLVDLEGLRICAARGLIEEPVKPL